MSYTPEELGATVDADGEVIDATPAIEAHEGPFVISPANAEKLRERCAEKGLDVAKVVTVGTDGRTDDPDQIYSHEIPAVKQALDAAIELSAPERIIEAATRDAETSGGHDGATPDTRPWDEQHPDEPF
jgi:hypothetical protein